MRPIVKVFPNSEQLALSFAKDFCDWVHGRPASHSRITVALSGGSTPKVLFQVWASKFANRVDWDRIHFFWGDERCVPPDDVESNFGVAKELFLDPLQIKPANVHRIRGESDPEHERARYENEVREYVELDRDGIPRFDLIILGMGDDGHTASIFPNQMPLLKSKRFCEVAIHPATAQNRITLTGRILNAAGKVVFLITGESKAAILKQVLEKSGEYKSFPAAHIHARDLSFLIDEGAAGKLTSA